MEYIVEADQLIKTYKDLPVLNGIDLKIKKGSIHGLIGRSGTGKSTFLRCVNGIEPYHGGRLLVDGTEVRGHTKKQMRVFRKNIGMVFQNFSLLTRKTVYENIALPMHCWGYEKKQIDHRTRELADLVGLSDKLGSKPKNLSGGQKQRVAIARALTLSPEILLCDEATSALDPNTTTAILDLLKQINSNLGISILVVTHQMSVIRQVCNEVSILEKGEIAAGGSVEKVFLDQSKALRNLLGEETDILPGTGRNIRLLLTGDRDQQLIFSQMARDLDVEFQIVGAKVEQYSHRTLGTFTLNIQEPDFENVTHFLTDKRIKWDSLAPMPPESI